MKSGYLWGSFSFPYCCLISSIRLVLYLSVIMATVPLSDYLFQRLRQLGVGSVHGVPGDFNLTLLDYVEPAGLTWVGNANELNAAYAADGYSRIKGLGAVVTTFGVGELSAINAIAGAYAELAPVVHIVGSPARSLQDDGAMVHHTFADGEYRRFAEMARHVTVAQAHLRDPRTCAQQIDDTLIQCLLHSRPVYIEVPVDMVALPIPMSKLDISLKIPDADCSPNVDDILTKVVKSIQDAKQPIILVDGETRPLRIAKDVQTFTDSTKWPTWTTAFGQGQIDSTKENYHGVYRGKDDAAETRNFFQAADLVIAFGLHSTSTNSYAFTASPDATKTIDFSKKGMILFGEKHRDVSAAIVLQRLLSELSTVKTTHYSEYPKLPRRTHLPLSESTGTSKLTHDKLWKYMGNIVSPGDIVMGETGSASWGVRDFALPQYCKFFSAITWLSIGYMLPAAQGAALAQKELLEANNYHDLKSARTFLFIGDGSLQMTIQELASIIRHNLNVTVVVINNDGYTIERCIHGRKQGYNDVGRWRYLEAPSFFGGDKDTFTAKATNWDELRGMFEDKRFVEGDGLKMVEVVLEREDFPPGILIDLLEAQKAKE